MENSILFVTERPEIVMCRGEGMYVWDTEGKKYLDFIGGWAVTSLGHCPSVVINAIEKQSRELINVSPSFYNKPMLEYAKLLTDNSCFDRVFFGSTGAEANEGAIKLARKYGQLYLNGAYEIITIVNSFHGRTLATMSATGKSQWDNLFEPKVNGFKHITLNDIKELRDAPNSNTCAIMIEPIQGEGGVYAAEKEYMKEIRRICDEKGILLIFDEVQTGLGRTGKLFAYEHYGIEPDIMTLAKGIGGGYPLSAMLAKENLNIFQQGDQGGTYCGQPLGMAVGIAVFNEVIQKNLSLNAKNQGEYIKKSLSNIGCGIKNIRGEGLLVAFDLPVANGKEIVAEALKAGLIINSPRNNIIRLMPALNVGKDDIDLMITILKIILIK